MLAVTIFASLAGLTSFATHGFVVYAILDSIFVGTGVGLFEKFYVQSLRGRWLRGMHPLLSISIYTAVVALLFLVAVHMSYLLTGQLDTLLRIPSLRFCPCTSNAWVKPPALSPHAGGLPRRPLTVPSSWQH